MQQLFRQVRAADIIGMLKLLRREYLQNKHESHAHTLQTVILRRVL